MNIISDYQWKDFLYDDNVPTNIYDEYDHLLTNEKIYGWLSYNDDYYHISDFLKLNNDEWHGYINETLFSGILVKISNDNQQYIIAKYINKG